MAEVTPFTNPNSVVDVIELANRPPVPPTIANPEPRLVDVILSPEIAPVVVMDPAPALMAVAPVVVSDGMVTVPVNAVAPLVMLLMLVVCAVSCVWMAEVTPLT